MFWWTAVTGNRARREIFHKHGAWGSAELGTERSLWNSWTPFMEKRIAEAVWANCIFSQLVKPWCVCNSHSCQWKFRQGLWHRDNGRELTPYTKVKVDLELLSVVKLGASVEVTIIAAGVCVKVSFKDSWSTKYHPETNGAQIWSFSLFSDYPEIPFWLEWLITLEIILV